MVTVKNLIFFTFKLILYFKTVSDNNHTISIYFNYIKHNQRGKSRVHMFYFLNEAEKCLY